MIRDPARSVVFSVVRAIPLKPSAHFVFGRVRQGVAWLLAAGAWNDAGTWVDGAAWNDGG